MCTHGRPIDIPRWLLVAMLTVCGLGGLERCGYAREASGDESAVEQALERRYQEWQERVDEVSKAWFRSHPDLAVRSDSSGLSGWRRAVADEEARRLFEAIVALGTPAIPTIMEKMARQRELGLLLLLPEITKFDWCGERVGVYMGPRIWTVDQFPELRSVTGPVDAEKVWQHWWKIGHTRMREYFQFWYRSWLDSTEWGDSPAQSAAARNAWGQMARLGIAALPYMMQVIERGDTSLVPLVSKLTDGAVPGDAPAQECVAWWRDNRDQWLMPWPEASVEVGAFRTEVSDWPFLEGRGPRASWQGVVRDIGTDEQFERRYRVWSEDRGSAGYPELGEAAGAPYHVVMESIEEERLEALISLGPSAIPHLIAQLDEDPWLAAVLREITRFNYHIRCIGTRPSVRLWAVEELAEVYSYGGPPELARVWQRWWLVGEQRTAEYFDAWYDQWLSERARGRRRRAEMWWQWVRDLGIAALPQMMDVIENGDARPMPLVAELTDGAIPRHATPEECLEWWEENRREWLIPWPEGTKAKAQ